MVISSTKRKRVSKKSKLSWRKHTKVADVEEFLEEQWEEERLGATLDTVTNDELFIIDAKPVENQVTSRQSRKLKALRPLKGFAALQPHTKVPDPIKKRNHVRTPDERKNELIKKKERENLQNGVLKAKELNALSERRLYEIKKEHQEKRGEFVKNIWSVKSDTAIEADPWAEPITKVHNLRNTGVPVKRVSRDVQKNKSPLPAVEFPHPGMSYNPSFKDHQDLLKTIADEEVKVIKKEQHLERVTRNMFRKVKADQKIKEWVVEMSEGISAMNGETEIKEEPEDLSLDCISVNPPVKNKKKTVQQRRKQREQMELQRQLQARKLNKKKIGDIHLIKIVQKNLEKEQKKQEKLRKLRKARLEQKKLKPKVLSATKFEDLGLDFQMGQEISGNLRNLKKEGNLLSDRFNSLQKRNILQPSKRAHQKKPKMKKYTKPGHKDDWEVTVARSTKPIGK